MSEVHISINRWLILLEMLSLSDAIISATTFLIDFSLRKINSDGNSFL